VARRNTTAKKRNLKNKRAAKKKAVFLAGILLSVIGIFLLTVALVPASAGQAGRFLHTRFLTVLFGRASILAGLYCLGIGIVLLIAKNKVQYFAGLTCMFLPSLVVANALFTTTQTTYDGVVTVHGVYVGHLFRSATTRFIGSAGLVLLSVASFICGVFLLTPRRVLTSLMHLIRAAWKAMKPLALPSRRSKPAKKEVSYRPRSLPGEAAAGNKKQSHPVVTPQPACQLMLERYNRQFVKIPVGLFEEHVAFDTSLPVGARRQEIIDAFASLNIEVDIGQVRRGPSFEQYEIIPGKAVKAAKIRNSVEDVALRIREKVHISRRAGRSLTIDVALAERQMVPYGYLLEDTADDTMEIPIAVGVDASFKPFSVDLVELPHMLVAGTTGSGKSIFLKTLIASIMYHLTPDEVRLVLVDPKRVEFGVFASSLFRACDIITDFEKVPPVFEALVSEMQTRYELLERAAASDIRQYNAAAEPHLRKPYIVAVVDEFADLLTQNVEGFEDAIIRLAQKARACGIHLVLATQRPSADVIKGILKTNIPGRIALSVSSKIDSNIILDTAGAENLAGKGDLICICPAFRDGIRLQGSYITNEQIEKIIDAKS